VLVSRSAGTIKFGRLRIERIPVTILGLEGQVQGPLEGVSEQAPDTVALMDVRFSLRSIS